MNYKQLFNRLLCLVCITITCQQIFAQELSAKVKVNAPNLSVSEKSIIQQMETAVTEFLNNQKFSNESYENIERIKCNFNINIREDLGANNFKIDLQIQSTRPVFNSNYESPILNIQEKNIPIQFEAYKPLQNSKETYYDNFSSILTYFAYLIIIMDNDSFSESGGDNYVSLLQNMIASMPATAKGADPEWTNKSTKNRRYFLIENYINSRSREFRKAVYEYHRLGLDNSEKDFKSARTQLIQSLESIRQYDVNVPQSWLMQLFVAAKSSEIIEIFKGADPAEKQKIYEIMLKIDASNSSNYAIFKS